VQEVAEAPVGQASGTDFRFSDFELKVAQIRSSICGTPTTQERAQSTIYSCTQGKIPWRVARATCVVPTHGLLESTYLFHFLKTKLKPIDIRMNEGKTVQTDFADNTEESEQVGMTVVTVDFLLTALVESCGIQQ